MLLEDLIGIPFVYDGRDLRAGVDCWGLAMEIYKRKGRKLPEYWKMAGEMKVIGRAIEEALPSFILLDSKALRSLSGDV